MKNGERIERLQRARRRMVQRRFCGMRATAPIAQTKDIQRMAADKKSGSKPESTAQMKRP